MANNDLETRLMELAKEKLSMVEVEVLKNMISENERLQRENSELKSTLDDLQRQQKDGAKEIRRLLEIVARAGTLDSRESGVLARELKQEVNELKAASEVEKRELVVDMFNTVFRNAEVKRNVFRNSSYNHDTTSGWKNGNSTDNYDTTETEQG